MNINDDYSKRAVINHHELPWVASPESGVDRRMLERHGGEVAKATSIVRYQAGSKFKTHLHHFGEELYVLEGVFSDEAGDYPASTYIMNPPGSSHAPFSDAGCTLFVKLRHLGPDQIEREVAYKSAFRDATYTYADFKRDVLSVLMRQYGNSVTSGSKAVVIDANGSRRKADVITAIKYRRYLKFRSLNDSRYVEGICFWNGSGKLIANYPIQHSRNLTIKHQNTSNLLKPLARIFKNMRSRMVEEQLIKSSSAPSYFIEGLLYNVPNDKLTSSYEHSVVNVLNWYEHEASKKELVCANEQYYLLRDGSHVCWNQKDSDEFVAAAVELWNQW